MMKVRIVGLLAALFVAMATFAQAEPITITGDLNWDSDGHTSAAIVFSNGPFGPAIASPLDTTHGAVLIGEMLTGPFFEPWGGPFYPGDTAVFGTQSTNLSFGGGTVNGISYL